MKLTTRMSTALATVALLAPAALAQAPAAGGTPSLFTIVKRGIEWPAYLILAGSIAAIALIVEHFITVRRATVAPAEQVRRARQLIEARKFRECLDGMRKSSTFFATVMSAALQHARHGFEAMHAAALEKSGEMSGRLFRKVEYLNILGNLGPLMGLLGTVLGMIVAFGAMSQSSGAADAGKLSQGISLALVNTLLGLALAVVGLGFFGVCRNRIDSLTTAATVEVLDLLEYFRPAASAVPRGEAPAAAPAAAAEPQRPAQRSVEQPA